MLAKVLVLALVAVATCEDHGYTFKALRLEPAQGYRHHYEHAPRVHEEREPARESQYSAAPENHGPAYSSQSIIHHASPARQEASQESTDEHVAPVYQYIQEEEEASVPRVVPAKHYQSIQYPAPAPVQHEPIQVSQPHVAIRVSKPHVPAHVYHARPHYSHGHEEESYHHGQLHEAPVHHSNQAEAQPQEAPVHHANQAEAQLHEAPVHYAHHAEAQLEEAPVHHAQHAEAQLHEAPVYHGHHAEVHAHDSHDEPIDYYAYPKYQYEYKVEDPHTGDNKFQHEFRDGDVVKGVYGLQEADGSIRTVEYSSDKHHGFSAIVKHSAPGQHVQIESHHN